MIAGTYAVSASLLVVTGFLFERGVLTATTQTVAWGIIFFFASAAASSAYLTVSEIFPLELRGLAIALFYSTGTALGGPLSSWLFGHLIDKGGADLHSLWRPACGGDPAGYGHRGSELRGQGRADVARGGCGAAVGGERRGG